MIKKTLKRKSAALHFSKKKLYLLNRFYYDRDDYRIRRIKINFVIIGSQKCGTTSLSKYLGQHPDIFMSSPEKEPGFFMYSTFLKNYFKSIGTPIKNKRDLFKNRMIHGYDGQALFGEASTYYTLNMQGPDFSVPEKMKAHNPNIKLIYIIRNPYERLVSHFKHIYKNNPPSFNSRLVTHTDAIQTSMYFEQLEPYLAFFEKKNIKVVLFEDLKDNPQVVLNEIFEFLGLKSGNLNSFEVHNKSVHIENMSLGYSKKQYDQLLPRILKNMDLFKEHLGLEIGSKWDLSEHTWCRNTKNKR